MTILDEFIKLRSASIYFVISVILIATTPITLGELLWNLMCEYFSEIWEEKLSNF